MAKGWGNIIRERYRPRGGACLLVLVMALLAMPLHGNAASAARANADTVLQRVFSYAASIDTTGINGSSRVVYAKATFNVLRRNPTLMLVPTMYAVAHGDKRQYITESFSRLTYRAGKGTTVDNIARLTTVPHSRRPMEAVAKYLTPSIYGETMIDNYLASPFHKTNRKFYRYIITPLGDGTVMVAFKPRRDNTQLVRGTARVDERTGRVMTADISGDIDNTRFHLQLKMGFRGIASLFPTECHLDVKFSFVGSKVASAYTAYYGVNQWPAAGLRGDSLEAGFRDLRPVPLTAYEQQLYGLPADSCDTTAVQPKPAKKQSWVKTVLWDVIGDNVTNRIKTTFGDNGQGYIRLNPVLNPLYMGYDHRRGFTYKIDLRMSYQTGPKSELSARFRGGYAFKQKQFFFRVPLFWYFDKRRDGYLKIEFGNGSHIFNSWVRREAEKLFVVDTLRPKPQDLGLMDEFRQGDFRVIGNLDFTDRVGLQVGVLYQWKTALHADMFSRLGFHGTYRSFAPVLELQVRPWGWTGPIFTADYDRGLRDVLKSNTVYERIELSADYIHHLNKLQAIKAKVGTGFYTRQGRQAYFLNYENFKENNIPGGWNDDWSGEFELLRSQTYNTSDYYVRLNATYESPMLLLSFLPWVGHYMEMERVYLSALEARGVHPYLEVGYGFTTKLLSVGLFGSNGKGGRYVGCKFGFELFRRW